MFFIMGINSDYKKLNFIQNFVCPDCGIVGEYQVFVAYTVLSLFLYLFLNGVESITYRLLAVVKPINLIMK